MPANLREECIELNRQNHGSPGYGLQIGPNSQPSLQLQALSEPWRKGDRVKSAVNRVAKFVGLPYWRCYDIWHGRARLIKPRELDLIAAAVQKKQEEDARNELRALKTRLEILEARLAKEAAEFHQPEIDSAIGAQTYGISGVGSATARLK